MLFSRIGIGMVAIAAIGALGSIATARGKGRECKPSGLPNQLGQTGAVAVAQPVEYWSKPWLLVADKQMKPDKIRLVSAGGEVIEIGKPPITVEPVQWLARGRAVYALSKGRSQTAGKTDVVLMRWGTDPRPRLTEIRTGVTLEGQLSAAFVNEFLAVSWAEKRSDGTLQRMVSFMDSEQLRVGEAKALGLDSGSAARVQPMEKSFAVLWTAPDGVMRASFDQFGKATSAVTTLAWAPNNPASSSAPALAVLQCDGRAWLMRDAGQELALSGETQGAMKELTRLPITPGEAWLPFQCVDDMIVIGRRTLDHKAGNITLWVSTVDLTGKVRDRRVKDTRGSADDIRMPQFSQAGAKLTSWWIEGKGPDAKVWSRELSCD
jgi:hypothetical protein